jgi:hypothetical protein
MEKLLRDKYSSDELDRVIASYGFENMSEVETMKKGLYIEFTGNIVMRLDS